MRLESIFNNGFLIKQFENIVNVKEAQSTDAGTTTRDNLATRLNELFTNLKSQFEFSEPGKTDSLDVLVDLKNLESFLKYLYQNDIKYNGKDIVLTTAAFHDLGSFPKEYTKYEREYISGIYGEGIIAYIYKILESSQKSNPVAVPYIQRIIDQLAAINIKKGIGSTDSKATPGTSTMAPVGAHTTAPGGSIAAPGGAAPAQPAQEKDDAYNVAFRKIVNMMKAGEGPLFHDRIDFNKLEHFLKNYSIIINNNSMLYNFNIESTRLYSKLPNFDSKILNTEPLGNLQSDIITAAKGLDISGPVFDPTNKNNKFNFILDTLQSQVRSIMAALDQLKTGVCRHVSGYDSYVTLQQSYGLSNISQLSTASTLTSKIVY